MENGANDFNIMQQVKRSLFAMRNGVVADSLRKAGCPHRIVFGVNLPQLNEIAAKYGPSEELAEALWADTALRESAFAGANALSQGKTYTRQGPQALLFGDVA